MTPVMLVVVWFSLHHRPHREIQEAPTSRAECLRLRRELIAESHRQAREGFPDWSPVSAQCMVMP